MSKRVISEIDVSKYFKVFDDGCEYFMEDMVDKLYKDIVNQNKQLQQYKQLCEQKTVDNFDLMSQIDSFKQKLKEIKKQKNELLKNERTIEKQVQFKN